MFLSLLAAVKCCQHLFYFPILLLFLTWFDKFYCKIKNTKNNLNAMYQKCSKFYTIHQKFARIKGTKNNFALEQRWKFFRPNLAISLPIESLLKAKLHYVQIKKNKTMLYVHTDKLISGRGGATNILQILESCSKHQQHHHCHHYRFTI